MGSCTCRQAITTCTRSVSEPTRSIRFPGNSLCDVHPFSRDTPRLGVTPPVSWPPRQRPQPAAGKGVLVADLMDAVTSLAKRRGIAFPSSEIYGGIRASWDFGPLGVELKRNIRNAWWREMVQLRDDMVGLEAAIIMSPRVWEASGHVAGFSDPLVECLNCHQRFRADHLPGFHAPQSGHEEDDTTLDMAQPPRRPNGGNAACTEPRTSYL